MRSVFVAGSRKSSEELMKVSRILEENGIRVFRGRDSPETEDDKILQMFERIDKSDVVYVVCPDGYIGRTVAMEIAYAYSKGKEIISSRKIDDFSAQGLVFRVMGTEELARHVK